MPPVQLYVSIISFMFQLGDLPKRTNLSDHHHPKDHAPSLSTPLLRLGKMLR
jgi:hypothetical protein